MPSIRISIIILCLIFCRIINCTAQDFSYKMFTIKDGLPGSVVSSVFQDSRGYLWISTEGGLSRYDGTTFKNYSISNGLPSYTASYGLEDSIGHIWFTYKEGVCDFDGTHFITYPIENPPENIWITQLLFTNSHKIWFVTGKGMFELQNGIWKRLDLIRMQPHTFLNQVVELNDHSLLINCLDSLVIRSANGKCRTIAYTDNENPLFQSICLIGGNYYVNTRNHLYLFRDNQLELILDDVLANKFVRTVFMDREHRLWIGTQKNGVYVFSGDSHIQINPSNLDSSNGHIYSIDNFCQDYEGNIWAATTSGLMKLSPSWVEFYDLRNNQKGVRSSFKDQNGTLYFGQANRGYMIWNDNKFISSNTLLDKSSARMVGNWIQGFACDEQKRLWLTDNNFNLLRITGSHVENMNNKLGLSINTNSIIFNPLDSNIYVGSTHGFIEIKNDSVHEKTLYGEAEDRIYTFASDPTGNIWIGTGKGKIFEKSGNNIFLRNRGLRLGGIAITKIKCPDSNELWISTEGSGIYKFHRNRSGSFVQDFHITSSDGLPNDIVHDFTFGKGGKVWIITLSGLASVQFYTVDGKENFSITKYGEEDGFRSTSFIYSSLLTDTNENVWLSTENYLARILTSQVINDTIPPIIHIENVKLFNTNTEWGKYASAFTPFFYLPKNPVLPYNQNDITIEYKAISFNDPDNITYSYKLEGIDEEWNSSGNNTHITFGNLSPGNYVFKVRAKKPLSAWSSPEAQFSFIINPPWWGTIWFKALVAILLIYISYLIYKIRLKQILAKAKIEKQISEKMLHERLRISRELHDDIGSALGSISIYSEVAKNRTEKNENAEEVLSKIGITSRQLIDKMSDIVWSLDSANENFEQLQNRMKTFLAMILTPLNLIYDFFVGEEIKKIQLSDEERKNIFLIFKEAIYNIVKYAECNKVDIILNMEDEVFKMLIRDDGKGFDVNSNDAYNGNGIRNMYARAKDINAIFILHSKKSEGTTIELSLAV
jgi:signal transduction histidine kinase/ligand-binding sensor domain-containing protein